jgi:hypothetical protein
MKKKLRYESFSTKVAKQISVSKEFATLVVSQMFKEHDTVFIQIFWWLDLKETEKLTLKTLVLTMK